MRLLEITINITTRHLEQEKREFIDIIGSIIDNNMPITDDEFTALLETSSTMMKRYNIADSGFREIFDAFSDLVSYYKANRR
jgi:hypothetical protein